MSKDLPQNPMHPKIPDEYKNETNYKKIPKQYLSRDIPRGRGMIKWTPMATMPQLFKDIEESIISQTHISRPSLSEDQLSQLNLNLHYFLAYNIPCNIRYYDDNFISDFEVIISKIDSQKMIIYCKDVKGKDFYEFQIRNIIEIY